MRANVGSASAPSATFDPLAPPAQPIELGLPPCGSVRVRVETDGIALDEQVSLLVLGDPGARALGTLDPTGTGAPGESVFPWVVLGREVEAAARVGAATARQRGAGLSGPQRR